MKVYRDIRDVDLQGSVVTIGTFDGLHLAHRSIIKSIVEKSKDRNVPSVLITFYPHPRKFVSQSNQDSIRLISSPNEKITELDKLGVDILVIHTFDRTFSELSAEDFIKNYLVEHIHPSLIVIGYDHKFGKDRKGNIDLLRALSEEYGYEVEEIPEIQIDAMDVNSTQIRKYLKDGHIREANELLGREYGINGTVIKGAQRGRLIGFPTANIKVDNKDKLLPRDGVYKVDVEVDGIRHRGALNIGYRPSLDATLTHTIEVYILDFDQNIYGKEITIYFLDFIRPEMKFNSAEELQLQIAEDVQKVR